MVELRHLLLGRAGELVGDTTKARFGLVAATAFCVIGCGPTLFTIHVNSAAGKLEEAHELGAEELAPYEYWMAKEHLEQSRSEAAEADYGNAIDLAEDSEHYSVQAIALVRSAAQSKPPKP